MTNEEEQSSELPEDPSLSVRINEIADQFLQELQRGIDDASSRRQLLVDQNSDIGEALEHRLKFIEQVYIATRESSVSCVKDGAEDIEHMFKPKFKADDLLVKIHCPHCGNQVNLVETVQTEVTCRNCGSAVSYDPDETRDGFPENLPGAIAHFRIDSLLGRGGFGKAYRAFDTKLSRVVAIKVPRGGIFHSTNEQHRFIREARNAASLRHPGIVQVYDVAMEGETPYIVCELIDGMTLADLISGRQLSSEECAKIAIKISEAVQYAHDNRVLHRDLKPSNILLDRNNEPFVADFGLARNLGSEITMTMDGDVLGTPAYMSPEQAKGQNSKLTFRSDVYSLGVILYRMLAGTLPFHGSQRMMVQQLLADEPKTIRKINQSVPKDLETITHRAMAKEPEGRYATAKDFADDLRRWTNHEPIRARSIRWHERLDRWRKRNPKVAALSFGIAALIGCATVLALVWAIRENQLRRQITASHQETKLSEQESRERLSSAHLQNGIVAMGKGELFTSMVWMTEALKTDKTHEKLQRLRLGLTHQQCPTLTGQWVVDGSVTVVKCSTDQKLALVATQLGNLVLLDLRSGEQLSNLVGATKSIRSAAFSPDSRFVTAVSDENGAFLWRVSDGKQVGRLIHGEPVRWSEFSSDSQRVATAGFDGFARVWSTEDGSMQAEFKTIGKMADQAVFSPDSKSLLMSSREDAEHPNALAVWDIDSGNKLFEDIRNPDYLRTAIFNRDGSRIFAGYEDGSVKIFDASNGTQVGESLPHHSWIRELKLLDDDRRLMVFDRDNDVTVWLWETGKPLRTFKGNVGPKSVLDSKERFVATTNDSGAVTVLWQTTMTPVCSGLRFGESVGGIDFHPDGRRILAGGKNGVVRMWDLAGILPHNKLMEHSGNVQVARFSPDGKTIVTASDGGGLIWDATSGTKIGSALSHIPKANDAAFNGDGSLIATGGTDMNSQTWNARTGEPVGPRRTHDQAVSRLVFSPAEDLLVTATVGGHITGWKPDSSVPVFKSNHREKIRQIEFSHDGQYFVTASLSDSAQIWNAMDGRAVNGRFRHTDDVRYCSFSPTAKKIATCSRDNLIKIWNATEPFGLIGKLEHLASVSTVKFNRDGSRILSCDLLGNTVLWKSAGSDFIRQWTLRLPEYLLSYCEFHPSEQIALVCGKKITGTEMQLGKGIAALWDLETGRPLSPPLRHLAGVNRTFFCPDGRRVLTSSEDTSARIWDLEPWEGDLESIEHVIIVLAGYQVDLRNQLTEIPAAELQAKYEAVSTLVPEKFSVTKVQINNWEKYINWMMQQTGN